MNRGFASIVGLVLLGTAAFVDRGAAQQAPTPTLDPAAFARVGTVDERFQSYNVEMVEVTGGRFWKPYGPSSTRCSAASGRARPGRARLQA